MERGPLNLEAARAAARDNLAATYLGLARGAPDAHVSHPPGMVVSRADPEAGFANFALRFQGAEDEADGMAFRLAAIGLHAPWFRVLLTQGDEPAGLSTALRRHGFVPALRLTVLAAQGMPPAWRSQAELRRVETAGERRRLADFMVGIFAARRPPSQRRLLAECTAGSPHALWTVGAREFDAGAMLSESEGALGLYNLCVAPRRQSQGLGSAVVRVCGAMATEQDRILVLQASAALVPWYRRLGFVEIGSVETFRPASG